MNFFKKTFLITIAALSLSSCSGCGGKIIQTKNQSKDSKILNPIDKLLPIQQPFTSSKTALVKESKTSLVSNNYLINQDKSLEVIISERGYTRFFIEDERITDVFVYPQEDIQVKIHQQGYLIVVPKPAHDHFVEGDKKSKEKIYVTITGENGTTQDFSLRITGKAPEPVKFIKSNLENNQTSKGE